MDIGHYKEWIQIGLNILHYRKERRLTQEQLADLCGDEGISRNFLQRIETGVSSCSVDTLIDIANALDIPLYKLFEFKEGARKSFALIPFYSIFLNFHGVFHNLCLLPFLRGVLRFLIGQSQGDDPVPFFLQAHDDHALSGPSR